ncbi:MAG: TetR/AcrR family transcriptional regulator [Clostridia bacterium]|nr:TetR/AcrR family transcriptional regulator [Clostridia bacterium]
MYKLCKTEQSTLRQRQIERELLSLMNQKSFEEITVTELSDRLSMPRKAFYRYFDSKEDALYALIDHTMAEYTDMTMDKSGETNRSLLNELDEYFKFWVEKKDLLYALDKSGIIGTLIERTVNFPLGDRIAVAKFLPDEDMETRTRIFKFAFAGLTYVMIEWYRGGFSTPTRDMARLAVRTFCQPLFPVLKDFNTCK